MECVLLSIFTIYVVPPPRRAPTAALGTIVFFLVFKYDTERKRELVVVFISVSLNTTMHGHFPHTY